MTTEEELELIDLREELALTRQMLTDRIRERDAAQAELKANAAKVKELESQLRASKIECLRLEKEFAEECGALKDAEEIRQKLIEVEWIDAQEDQHAHECEVAQRSMP